MRGLRIGEAARRAGVTPATLRYYEAIGLLPRPARTASGYRVYDPRTLADLRFIRRMQALGFALRDLAPVLQAHRAGRSPCATIAALARRELADLEARIAALERMRDRLAAVVDSWERRPCPDERAPCALIEEACAPEVDAIFPEQGPARPRAFTR